MSASKHHDVTSGDINAALNRDPPSRHIQDVTSPASCTIRAKFRHLPPAVSNAEQRAQIGQYFERILGDKPTAQERRDAAAATIKRFPVLIDHYIKLQEDAGDQAQAISAAKVDDAYRILVDQVREALGELATATDFFDKPWSSYEECLERVLYFKHYIEHQDGYRLFNRAGKGFSSEKEIQLAFGLVWCGTEFDINRETNNGRGPADYKASFGAGDKSLIEFKLASSTSLKRNLEKQVKVYEAANRTHQSVKVIISYTDTDEARARGILRELGLDKDESVVLIDARSDNKPSASNA